MSLVPGELNRRRSRSVSNREEMPPKAAIRSANETSERIAIGVAAS